MFTFGKEGKLVLVLSGTYFLVLFVGFVFHFSQRLEIEKAAEVSPQLFCKSFRSILSGFLVPDYLKRELLGKHMV